MEIREEVRGQVCLITPSGRLDSTSAPALEAVLPARVQAQGKVVLDLAETAYVSSAGLRVLLMGAKAARSGGHRLVLCGLSAAVQEVFDVSGFSSIFSIEPDVDAALSAIA